MQNRYTGDIGDYGKLGLLRVLRSSGLSIGVNWYLRPDEDNGDGRHISYLKNESFQSCDESLWMDLKRIVDSGQRRVSALQNANILKATFFDVPIDYTGMSKTERIQFRKNWHEDAVRTLSGVDVVFVDPDNGLIVKSAMGKKIENKYVMPEELFDYYEQGSSVIYYQHKARKKDSLYTEYHNQIIQRTGFEESTGLALKFITTSQRFFFFIIQPLHREVIFETVKKMVSTAWGEHFCIM